MSIKVEERSTELIFVTVVAVELSVQISIDDAPKTKTVSPLKVTLIAFWNAAIAYALIVVSVIAVEKEVLVKFVLSTH